MGPFKPYIPSLTLKGASLKPATGRTPFQGRCCLSLSANAVKVLSQTCANMLAHNPQTDHDGAINIHTPPWSLQICSDHLSLNVECQTPNPEVSNSQLAVKLVNSLYML